MYEQNCSYVDNLELGDSVAGLFIWFSLIYIYSNIFISFKNYEGSELPDI